MSIEPRSFYNFLVEGQVNFFVGVPDSLLQNFCKVVDEFSGDDRHVIASNEGNAVSIAMGWYMATGNLALVYMQNSGLGNAINPLTSLIHQKIASIPMLIMVGWRGEPGLSDEPQHLVQGDITLRQLELLEIPYSVIDANTDFKPILKDLLDLARHNSQPVALVIKAGTFSKFNGSMAHEDLKGLQRELVLNFFAKNSGDDDLFICTTGKTSREMYEIRKKLKEKCSDFLSVGGMGHLSSIALGLALALPSKRIFCLDGDGALIMHLGSLAINASKQPKNFVHIVLNNGTHESVGGQKTCSDNIDFHKVATGLGYLHYFLVRNESELIGMKNFIDNNFGPIFVEIKIISYSRSNLGRPEQTVKENVDAFMKKIGVN